MAIDTPFLVTGGETKRPPNKDVNPSQRQINIQTFLWSGSELIAKVEGLWASQLNYPIRTS